MKKLISGLICLLCSAALFAQNPTAYLKWMQANLPAVPEWTAWQTQTGELPPDFSKLKKNNLLPDPLKFEDGRPIKQMATDWPKRRAEILGLFEKWETGTMPQRPSISSVVLLDESKGQGYTVKNVRVGFGKGSVRVRLVIPDGAAGEKFPVMISPNLAGWAATVIRRRYISAGYAGNDAMDDAAPLKDAYPNYDFATLPRRAWLAGVVIDYLYTLPQVDKQHIAINGYSRDGKMATLAAAFDTRITAVIAGSTGVGGLVPWRFAGERGGGEGIETTTRSFPGWFLPRLRYFSGHEDYLPVDGNLLIALIAPRAVLMEWGHTDQVANGWAMEQAYQSAQRVYQKLGAPNKLNMISVEGFHGSDNREADMDWLDEQFGRSKKNWTDHLIFPWSFDRWKAETGEHVDLSKAAIHPASSPLATSAADWDQKADVLRTSISWMLGDTPPMYTDAGGFTFRPRPGAGNANAGPTEIGKGAIGNPGQLAPDVPSWVISSGGGSYGWRAPEKNEVTSRRIRFNGVTGDLYYPVNTPQGKKLPTVIWLHGFHYPLGYMWVYRSDLHPILALAKAGYAVLAYDQTGFGTRWNEAAGFYDHYPHWSQMGKMVEDLHTAVDVLEKDSVVDVQHISVYGFSMGGVLGLYAAALDKRITGVVSICGFTPMREDTPDKGMSGMTRYSHLHGLIPRLGLYAGNENKLPYDFDDLVGLIAPRPVLIVQPKQDRDANPAAVRKAVERAQQIYQLKHVGNKLQLQEPDDYGRLTDATQNSAIQWMTNNF